MLKLKNYLASSNFYLTQGYGVNAQYYSQFGLLFHEGIDLGSKDKNPPVRALHDGIVTIDHDPKNGAYGNFVVIWDDKQLCATWYCHFENNQVNLGQRVKAGDILGNMGSTGNSTGQHLHLNFVLTDHTGNRLFNTKQSNLGFLDPQYPGDPNPKKYPPGVPKYIIKWEPINSVPIMPMPEDKKLEQFLQSFNIKTLDEAQLKWKEDRKFLEDERKKNDKKTSEILQLKHDLGKSKESLESSEKEIVKRDKKILDLSLKANKWDQISKAHSVDTVEAMDKLIQDLKLAAEGTDCQLALDEQKKICVKEIETFRQQFAVQKELLKKQIKSLKEYKTGELISEVFSRWFKK